MPITQPTYPVRTDAVVSHVGSYVDAETAPLDTRLDAAESAQTNHSTSLALSGTPHGLPALTTDGQGWVREGGAMVARMHRPSTVDGTYLLGAGVQWVSQRHGNDANDGLLQGTAKATINAALAALPTGGLVLVEPGYYTVTPPLRLFCHEIRGVQSNHSSYFNASRPTIYMGGAGDFVDTIGGASLHNLFVHTGRSDSGAFWRAISDSQGSTTLTVAPTSSATTLTVADTTGFPTSGRLILEWSPGNTVEIVTYTGKTGTTFTGCSRGAWNTRAQAHSNGGTVTAPPINFLRGSNLRVSADGGPGGTDVNMWTRILDWDGATQSSPIGIRSTWIDGSEFFGCKTAGETLRLKRLVHAWFTNSNVITAPAQVTAQGIKVLDNLSEAIYFDNFENLGNFYSEAGGGTRGVMYRGRIDGTVTFGTGSAGNIVEGHVSRPTSDLGTNNTVLSPWRGPPRARVHHSVDQAVATVTVVTLAFNSERYDTAAMHDNATNNSRLTCVEPGLYEIGGSVQWESNATGFRLLRIARNGTDVIAKETRMPSTSSDTGMTISTQYQLAAGDYVQLEVYQASGATIQVSAQAYNSPEFWMSRVGGAG